MFRLFLPVVISLVLLAACASPPPYRYHYVPEKTAGLSNGLAIAPPEAPADVQAAIAAGNRIAGLPYAYGAGHTRGTDCAYDCSGAASYLLEAAGRLDAPTPSKAFRHYGESGYGEWISIYARRDHVFLVVAGLRFDTGWTHGPKGPQWTIESRPADGCVLRHPTGL
jgi:hypothetical protein